MGDPVKPRWILFDAADTLIYAQPSVSSVYAQCARRFGHVPPDEDALRQRFPRAMSRHFAATASSESLDRERWREVVTDVLDVDDERVFGALWDHFAQPESWRVFPDVAPTWRALRGRGYRLGIASNFDARLAALCRELTPLSQAEHVFFSSQLGYRKPDARFFEAIAQRLGDDGEHLLLVGDQWPTDCVGAQRAGWQAVLLDRDGDRPQRPAIRHLTDLLTDLP